MASFLFECNYRTFTFTPTPLFEISISFLCHGNILLALWSVLEFADDIVFICYVTCHPDSVCTMLDKAKKFQIFFSKLRLNYLFCNIL